MDRPNRSHADGAHGARRPARPASPAPAGTVLDVLLALALCLPVACLTPTALFWPQSLGRTTLGPLDGAIRPEVSGVAWVACASALPLALALCVRRGRHSRGLALYLGAALCALLGARGASDTFELARAELFLAATFALLWSGSALGQLGRRVLARGLVFVSLVLTGGALAAAQLGHPAGLSGALGNTGSVSEAALAGAAIGGLMFARERGGWSWIGLAAIAVFGVYVGRSPVLAGALSLAATLVLALLWAGPARRRIALAAATFLGAFAVSLLATGTTLDPDETRASSSATVATAPTIGGGIAVRQRLWNSVTDLIAANPLFGVGAGQFAAAFPPYRDSVEIELSSHGRQLWQETEVEHAHADLLQFAAEAGLLGGALWVTFLVFVVLALRRSLLEQDACMPFALAAFAFVANGLARTPLTWNPASAAIAFTVFGTLLARAARTDETVTGRRLTRWIGWIALALLASRLPAALELIRHERALRASFTALAQGPATEDDVEAVRSAAEAALDARADSPLAHAHLARLDALVGVAPESVRAHWQALLRYRPASIEGLVQDGVFAIRTGRHDQARDRWERVVELDPGHPIARRNLVRIAAELDDCAGIEEHARALESVGRLPESFVLEVAAAAGARGQRRSVDVLIALVAEATAPEVLNALAERAESAGNETTAQGLRATAHRAWGSEHAANGAWNRAVRSLRSARSAAAAVLGAASRPFEREYAAALAQAGRDEEARQVLASLTERRPDESEIEISEWARQALAELVSAAR